MSNPPIDNPAIREVCLQSLNHLTEIATAEGIDCKRLADPILTKETQDFAFELAICPNDEAVKKAMHRHKSEVAKLLFLGRMIIAQIDSGKLALHEAPEPGGCPHFYLAHAMLDFFAMLKEWQKKSP